MSLDHTSSRRRHVLPFRARRAGVKLGVALLLALPAAASPPAALAQPAGASWNGDPCHQEQRAAGAHGTVLGALVGGLLGWTVAGREHRAAGAVAGGTVGAVAGGAVAAASVTCIAYPRRVENHQANCQWVTQDYDGAPHEFEVCKDPDGAWRPSGRS